MVECAFDGGSSSSGSGSGFTVGNLYIGFLYNGSATNNESELKGLLSVVILLNMNHLYHAKIYGDSTYCINGINDWCEKWSKNGWIKSQGAPVLNENLWRNIWSIVSEENYELIHVKGHSDNFLNNVCDELTWLARELKYSRVVKLDELGISYMKNLLNNTEGDYQNIKQFINNL